VTPFDLEQRKHPRAADTAATCQRRQVSAPAKDGQMTCSPIFPPLMAGKF
jgi:hypothetical protein